MIVKMKKVTVLVPEKEIDASLDRLRQSGAVHIKHMRQIPVEDISAFDEKIDNTDSALKIIAGSEKPEKGFDYDKAYLKVKEILALEKEREKLGEEESKINRDISKYANWGGVKPEDLSRLSDEGVFIKLYFCSSKEFKKIPPDKTIEIVSQKKSKVYFALITRDKKESLGLQPFILPDLSKADLQKKAGCVREELTYIERKLNSLSKYAGSILKLREQLLKEKEFFKVRTGMAQEAGFAYLQGYCPLPSLGSLNKVVEKNSWGLLVEEPDNPEEVPTLVKNPRWVEIIQPVFKFMGTVPGYKEYDISLWFLVFFSLFFAMLIGDAGYGILFLASTIFVRKKKQYWPQQPFFLIYLLSGATIIWGAVSGTWFGSQVIAGIPLFNNLIVQRFNVFVSANQDFLIYLCFIIGAVQLSIAHGMRALRYINSLFSLAQLGWILIEWGIFFLIGTLVVDKPFPKIAAYFLGVGVTLVVLCSNPQKSIFKSIAVSVANLPLNLINSFSDTLSYLRLFAVGFATVKVAQAFNEIAATVGFSGLWPGLGAAVILFIGHSLNILLGIMSVLVHGIRLNMLEFSGHLNMEWAGREYRPFK